MAKNIVKEIRKAMGGEIVPLLRKYLKHEDNEVRHRVERIVASIGQAEAKPAGVAAEAWSDWSPPLGGMQFRARTRAIAVTGEDQLPAEIEIRNAGNEALYVLHPDRLPDGEASVRFWPFVLIEGRRQHLCRLLLVPLSQPGMADFAAKPTYPQRSAILRYRLPFHQRLSTAGPFVNGSARLRTHL